MLMELSKIAPAEEGRTPGESGPGRQGRSAWDLPCRPYQMLP